jgi:hypothetical protein
LIVCLGIAVAKVYAHDHDRPELDDWYQGLRAGPDGKGTPCCEGGEASHLSDPDWKSENGHYSVRLEGEWVKVPDDAVVQGPNRDGRALVWTYQQWTSPSSLHRVVRCFIPGSMT